MMIAAPINVSWLITNRCNYRCGFCWRVLNRRDVSLLDAKMITAKLAEAGTKKISWAGGEPLLWSGIEELIDYTKSCGVETMLITNGSLLETVMPNLPSSLDWLTLPLEGIGDDANTRAGRDPGHFTLVERLLCKYRNMGTKLKINTVATKNNIDDILEIVQYLEEWNIRRWKIFQFYPVRGIARRNSAEFELSNDRFECLRRELMECTEEISCDVVVESIDELDRSYFTIAPDGCVYVSDCGVDIYIGDLRTGSAQEIFEHPELDKQRYTRRSEWLLDDAALQG